MRAPAAIALVIVAAFVVPAFAAEPMQEPSGPESAAIGRAVTARLCSVCHAVGRRGMSPNPSAPPFRHLNRRMDVDSLGEGLATGILTNHPKMPVFHLAPREVVGVVRYLKSVQERPAQERRPR